MKKWVENFKAHRQLDKYALLGYRLVEDAWYGDDGMSDCRGTLPLEEYMLKVLSWEKDPFNAKHTVASTALSRKNLNAYYKSKDEANKAWLEIVKRSPSYSELKKMGFR